MRDELGAEVPLTGPARRVVSLVPSITEAVAVSAPGRLVGATEYCAHPPDLDVTRVGGSKYPVVDAVLALAPDLVLANAEENRPADVARLRSRGVPVFVTAAPETVPAGLASLRRILVDCLGLGPPDWWRTASSRWEHTPARRCTAVVPVWRRPWVVLGGRTFATDLLRRLGVDNAYSDRADRYPRPKLPELLATVDSGAADLLVLPDEPYRFTSTDGPDAFPGIPHALVSGRHLTWYGPSLVEAPEVLLDQLAAVRR
ncbi:helical backbone metal receptor [Actinoalloteichus spitiensis]|uniref:helical backbone metal receptor n=1 Tax=Actinoalloteichus spitiensis TaxID=252394 RepID=UPI0003636547|nr:helical backbone metal receptor [Actinoalloteichus spitiensis]